MRALRCHVRILGDLGFVGGVGELRDGALRYRFQWRRGEKACVAGMQRRSLERLIDNIDARAELVLVNKSIQKIEAAAEVDCQLLEWFPFVLQVEAVEVTVLVVVISTIRSGIVLVCFPLSSTGKTNVAELTVAYCSVKMRPARSVCWSLSL